MNLIQSFMTLFSFRQVTGMIQKVITSAAAKVGEQALAVLGLPDLPDPNSTALKPFMSFLSTLTSDKSKAVLAPATDGEELSVTVSAISWFFRFMQNAATHIDLLENLLFDDHDDKALAKFLKKARVLSVITDDFASVLAA